MSQSGMAQALTIQQTEFTTGEISSSITLIHSQSGSICGHQILHAFRDKVGKYAEATHLKSWQ
jgi:hypothetical protein